MADRLRCVVKRITYQNPDNGYSVIHKSQGSEYLIVVMPVMMTHYVMLQRNLVYTGITRAKKGLVLSHSDVLLVSHKYLPLGPQAKRHDPRPLKRYQTCSFPLALTERT